MTRALRTANVGSKGKTFRQLGNGSTVDSTLPIDVTSVSTAVSVAASQYRTCVVLEGGSVECREFQASDLKGDE